MEATTGSDEEERFALGISRARAGDLAGAGHILEELVLEHPARADFLYNLAMVYHQQRRWDPAVSAYRQAIALEPEDAAFHYSLGKAFFDQGQVDRAIQSYGRAAELQPNSAQVLNNLGNALHAARRSAEAVAVLRRAVELAPGIPMIHSNLGNSLLDCQEESLAIEHYRRAIELAPKLTAAHLGLGVALLKKGEASRALESLERALVLSPDHVGALTNLGGALRHLGRFDEAMVALERACGLDPNAVDAWGNLGIVLTNLRRAEPGLEAFQRALQLDPRNARIRYNHAGALLMQGRFVEGFAEYEWRFELEDARLHVVPSKIHQPRWRVDGVPGQRVFVYTEQGFGDAIQFVRYVPLLAATGAQVLLCCRPPLLELLRSLEGVTQLTTTTDPIPDLDCHFPLLSLPHAFGTTLETIPGGGPYLRSREEGTRAWGARLDPERLRVGLVWAGSPTHDSDEKRSVTLSILRPLAAVPGVRLYSLQKGDAARQVVECGSDLDLVDFTSELDDFADTADLVAALDLVISVDTAVAHLAGALGKPVWVLCRFESEWRWMHDREDSPWYPTMRLFRQQTHGAWDEVVARVALALTELAAAVVRQGER